MNGSPLFQSLLWCFCSHMKSCLCWLSGIKTSINKRICHVFTSLAFETHRVSSDDERAKVLRLMTSLITCQTPELRLWTFQSPSLDVLSSKVFNLALNSSTWQSDPETSSRLMNRPSTADRVRKLVKHLYSSQIEAKRRKRLFGDFLAIGSAAQKTRSSINRRKRNFLFNKFLFSRDRRRTQKAFKSFLNSRYSFLNLFFARATIKIEHKCLSAACRREWNVPSVAWKLLAFDWKPFSRCSKRLFRDGLSRARRRLSSARRNSLLLRALLPNDGGI